MDDHKSLKSHFSYSILAPNAIPQGFVEAKEASGKVLEALQLDADKYKLGHTKVFFRAGVLGMLEELREERLSAILAFLQAHIRGYMMRRNYQKLQDQRYEILHQIKRFTNGQTYLSFNFTLCL